MTEQDKQPVSARIAAALDQQLLDILEHGRPAIDSRTGLPAVDDDGKQITKPPSAADLQAARRRLADLGVKTSDGDPSLDIAAALQRIRLQDERTDDVIEDEPVADATD